jgi:hypothetical protein
VTIQKFSEDNPHFKERGKGRRGKEVDGKREVETEKGRGKGGRSATSYLTNKPLFLFLLKLVC